LYRCASSKGTYSHCEDYLKFALVYELMEVNEDSGQLSSRKLCVVVGEVVMPWSAFEELATSQSRCCPRSLTPKLNSVGLGFWLVEYMLVQAIRNTHLVLLVYDILMNAICLLKTLLCA
jgi:hypothetical protein